MLNNFINIIKIICNTLYYTHNIIIKKLKINYIVGDI
jgi:hypothetical protein